MIFNLNTLCIYTEDLHHKLQQTKDLRQTLCEMRTEPYSMRAHTKLKTGVVLCSTSTSTSALCSVLYSTSQNFARNFVYKPFVLWI
jgi:hypothetical protein